MQRVGSWLFSKATEPKAVDRQRQPRSWFNIYTLSGVFSLVWSLITGNTLMSAVLAIIIAAPLLWLGQKAYGWLLHHYLFDVRFTTDPPTVAYAKKVKHQVLALGQSSVRLFVKPRIGGHLTQCDFRFVTKSFIFWRHDVDAKAISLTAIVVPPQWSKFGTRLDHNLVGGIEVHPDSPIPITRGTWLAFEVRLKAARPWKGQLSLKAEINDRHGFGRRNVQIISISLLGLES